MWVSLEHDNDKDWNREDDRPDTFDATLVIIEEELAAAPLANPALHGHDLHEVVSKSDRQDRHGRDVQHWVELANLSNDGDVLEVLVEELVYLAGVNSGRTIFWGA